MHLAPGEDRRLDVRPAGVGAGMQVGDPVAIINAEGRAAAGVAEEPVGDLLPGPHAWIGPPERLRQVDVVDIARPSAERFPNGLVRVGGHPSALEVGAELVGVLGRERPYSLRLYLIDRGRRPAAQGEGPPV